MKDEKCCGCMYKCYYADCHSNDPCYYCRDHSNYKEKETKKHLSSKQSDWTAADSTHIVDDLLRYQQAANALLKKGEYIVKGLKGEFYSCKPDIFKMKYESSSQKETATIEQSKEEAKNLNELADHLIRLLESDDKRFSFEFCAGGIMEVYDKEKEIGYAVCITPIKYDEKGNATNL